MTAPRRPPPSDCECVCAVDPKSCCIKITWDKATPLFRAGVIKDDSGQVVQRYVQGSPERNHIELVSSAGKTGACHLLQSVHEKTIYTAPIDEMIKNKLATPDPQHPKLKSRVSGGTTVIEDDPLDYDVGDNVVNAGGNATISDRPDLWNTREDDVAPIVYHLEAVFAVWCKEALSVKATWGWGFTVTSWAPIEGHFYRWRGDCVEPFKLEQWEL